MLDGKDNPRGKQALDVSVAFTVLATISVSLRLYTRWFIVRAPGIEDYLIAVATVRIRSPQRLRMTINSISDLLDTSDYRHCIP